MKMKLIPVLLLVGLLALTACSSPPSESPAASSGATQQGPRTLSFVDYAGFDRELNAALKHNDPVVTVALYDKVSPNNTPDRLQKWLNAVERNGGRIDIQPPPNELSPKSPLALISLVGTLWSAIKATSDFRDSQLTQAVKGHDALISLERNAAGQVVIASVLFKKSAP